VAYNEAGSIRGGEGNILSGIDDGAAGSLFEDDRADLKPSEQVAAPPREECDL